MIKLLDILHENKILVPRRSTEERQKNYLIATEKRIQQYIKDGSKGNLILSSTPITSLPDNLKVEGSLDLFKTLITSLPNNLQVGRDLNLNNTEITSLPNNLQVGRNLYLNNTPITSLPDNLKVGEGLYLTNTPLSEKYSEEEIRKMVPGVKGDIILQYD
jgi:hypothetical protein